MTSTEGVRTGHQGPLEDYKTALAQCTVQTSCGQSYVRVSKLVEWWKSDTKFGAVTTSQATRLIEYAYRNWRNHSHSNHMSRDKLLGNNPCIVIFSILLEIGWGDLIHLFALVELGWLDDKRLPFHETSLRGCLQEMSELSVQRPRKIPVDVVYDLFFQAQWKFCPATFRGVFNHYHPLIIIPIHRKEPISTKGGTAKLYEIEILSEFVRGKLQQDARDSEYTPIDDPDGQGSRYHFALKTFNSYGGDKTCYNEVEAFMALTDHNLTITTDGVTKKYAGWHADIKPDNILQIDGKFKLADPGFARFVEDDAVEGRLDPIATMRGGTYTYGAPELHKGWQMPSEVHQTIDVWSLGCVFSVTATWVALGYEGIKQYSKLRSQAILNRLNAQGQLQSHPGPKLDNGDYFHDGLDVLPEVIDWHKYLRAVLRRTDRSTGYFLDLVDKHMLVGIPNDRSKSCDLSESLDRIRSHPESSQAPIPESILTFLKDLDEGISNELTSSTITYESVPRSLPLHSTFKDRENQKSKYRDAPFIPTTLRSQRRPTRRASRAIGKTAESIVEGIATNQFEQASPDPTSPNRNIQRRTTSRHSFTTGSNLPSETIEQSRFTMEEKRKKKSSFSFPFFPRGSKKDEFLARHYKNRDIKFLIDNSGSMGHIWEDVKYVLETLLLKVKGLDDNGIDLYFTQGNVRVRNEKDIATIMAKMDLSETRPMDGVPTDFLEPLADVFKEYKREIERNRRSPLGVKNMTLIVLSDGIWPNTAEEVGNLIIAFIQNYQEIMDQHYMDQQCSIEFIQFGNNEYATETFQYLDDDLQGIPDVVDYENRNGDVIKMLLGSFKKHYDNINNDPPLDDISISPTQSEDLPNPVYTAKPSSSRRPTYPPVQSSRLPSDGGGSSSQAVNLPRRSTANTQGTLQSTDTTKTSHLGWKRGSVHGTKKN